MKLTFRLYFLLIISLFFSSCSRNEIKSTQLKEVTEPEFNDNDKTVDSLKQAYNCQNIEYNNWDVNEASDSSLTVELVNSTKVVWFDNIDSTSLQLKGIALAIRKALIKPESYKSFYIVFIENGIVKGQEIKIHKSGMKILSKDL